MSGDLRALSTRAGWEEFVTAPPRQRPDPLTAAQVRGLSGQARAEYEERRSVWHANLGPLRTPQMRAVCEQLDDIVEANRQDGDKVKGAAVIDAYPGLGKSTIARVFAREFHQRQVSLYGPATGAGHDRIPVAHVCLTSSTSKRSFNAMLCRFFGLPGHDRGNAEELGHRAADAVLACDVRLCVVDDVHFLDVTRRDGREVANHFKYLANTYLQPNRGRSGRVSGESEIPEIASWMGLPSAIQHGAEVGMRVQRVLMPGTDFESWTVLGEDHRPVEPVERFLSYLASIEKSPNTIKAYAHDLKDWMTYLDRHGVDWRTARLEDVAGFVAWLRVPPQARDGQVAVLPTVAPHCSAASVNRKLSAVTSFCGFHARHGVEVPALLISLQPATGQAWSAATSYRPFLHHVSRHGGERRRTIKLKAPKTLPKVLTVQQVQTILDACEHLRDRLLFALMLDTGVRVGEALGLRHEDIAIAEKTVAVVRRDNANRARAKTGTRTIPASAELMHLYADYLTREYGSLDSDYVFVNLWSAPLGRPWSYSAVYDLVERLRARTGIAFGPHLYRHTYATWLLRRGAGMESVKELLGHASITTTIDTYGHLTVEDARQTLEAAGWFTGRQVRW